MVGEPKKKAEPGSSENSGCLLEPTVAVTKPFEVRTKNEIKVRELA